MSYINKYLRNFKPYKLASHKVWNVDQAERDNILKLDWNEATIEPTPLVKERIQNLLQNNDFFHLYPATNNTELYGLLSRYVKLPKENIQYFGSSDSAHEYIAKMFISVGDPVLILWPSYDNFRLTAEVNGARVFFSEFDDNFQFDPKKFESDIEKTTPSLVYICNPNNPTGYLHSREYIEYLLNKYSDIIFLIDEAYYEFSGESVSDLVLQYENVLVTRTMSKAFALANYRFGYLLASENNISYISSIRNPKNITTFAQEAAIAVLSDIGYMQEYVSQVEAGKQFLVDGLKQKTSSFSVYPSRGNFVLIKCCSFECKMQLIDFMEQNNVFIRNLSQSISLKCCVRISIGTPDQMKRVVDLMYDFDEEFK